MVGKLGEIVSADSVLNWILIAFLVIYFVYKEWPDFKKRISSGPVKEQQEVAADRTMEQRLDTIETDVKEIKQKLDNDYVRINRMEQQINKNKSSQANTSVELEIIMEALLGALGGLQELGANGPTREAKDKIQNYLNRKAHRETVEEVIDEN